MFLLIYAFFVFYAPNVLGDPQNYIPANPLQTPPEIVPEWYFLPFYAILRSMLVRSKLLGVMLLFSSILVLFVLPWLDTSRVRSARFRPVYKWVFWLLVIDVLALGYVGAHPPEGIDRHHRPDRDLLLFLPLPDPVPADRQVRAAAAAADQHRRRGARERPGRAPAPLEKA